ncbi:MAG: hypothetical protein ACRCZU_03835 [Selenomonadaceae bacterium]|jgi:hypothetical protein
MDLSPMNLQVIIPKSTEVGQVQHKLNHQGQVQQEAGAVRLHQDDALKQKQVRTREELEDGKVKDEQQQNTGGGGKRRQKSTMQPEEDAEENLAVDAVRGHHIDIKL